MIENENLIGERVQFQCHNKEIVNCTFTDGDSPLKEAKNINISSSTFKWKYPLWYAENINLIDSQIMEMGRSGIWYTENINVENTLIQAPKNFRRSENIKLNDVFFANAEETLWNCQDIEINNSNINGDYFAMNSKNIKIENVKMTGNYSFDGCENIEIHNSRLLSKDAFWNTNNVTVYDSVISGEYIGWNSKNLKFVNCTIESLQGFCYIENLELVNCKLLNTTGAFEYCTVNVESTTKIDSILNPISGTISAPSIGEVTFDDNEINPKMTTINIKG